MVTSALVKVAVMRCPGFPVGQPAPCVLNCRCGAFPVAPEGEGFVTCRCGKTYNALGYLLDDARARAEGRVPC